MNQIGTLLVNFDQREIHQHGRSVRVGARAFDILEVLFRANGTILSKDDIMDAVWPGLIVEENRLQVHIAALRKLLGGDRDLIKTVPGRGYLLVAQTARTAEADTDTLRQSSAGPQGGMLPAGVARLIGRQAEVEQIVEQMGRAAVTTLVGAGGIGKTCLAVHVARAMRDRGERNVYFVELAQAASPDAVLATLAAAVGLADAAQSLTAQEVADALADTGCLLVLDNAEHVIDAVASLVEVLVLRNPALRVLVTSREPLRIWTECVFRVEPLAVPANGASADTILAHSAVELFLHRARAIAPGCASDEASLAIVADICRRLEGLPLAVELAAARVATLGVEGVASRLDDRLNLLTGGLRSALPRHQALRATFDWSYALLDSTSRALFRRLAFFTGTFNFDAVCAVATEPGMPVASVITSLSELATKSLVNVECRGAIAQYRLTESTRAYAMEKLRDEGEVQLIGTRHMLHVQKRMEEGALPVGGGPLGGGAQERPLPSLDEARTACDWALAGDGDRALGVAMAGSLVCTLLEAGLVHECRDRAQRALTMLDTLPAGAVDTVCEMRLCTAYASTLLYTDVPVHNATSLWNRVLWLARDAGDEAFQARALWGLWNTMLTTGDIHASMRFATRFQHLSERSGSPFQQALAAQMLAVSLHLYGEHEQARERIEHATNSIDESRPSECSLSVDPLIIGNATLARMAWIQGDAERAMQYIEKAMNRVRADMLEPSLSHLLAVGVVPLALQCGELETATRYLSILRSQAAIHRFESWRDYAECLAGQIDIECWRTEAGLARMGPALARLLGRGFRRLVTPLIVAWSEGLTRAGRIDEARAKLDETLAHCEANGEYMFVPELLRVRGIVELERARRVAERAPDAAELHEAAGRRLLSDAMRLAHEHDAPMWELRAALDFAGHLAEKGQLRQAAALTTDLSPRFNLHSDAPDIRRLVTLGETIAKKLAAAPAAAHGGEAASSQKAAPAPAPRWQTAAFAVHPAARSLQ
ncbi:ATP-binding protein [Paraburkholderia kururiensis]|uniref:Winged helix-turn-helix domain-containing protein n=1 Tax=Paraburkholderia kururiensis TaxID=984307 RepID=A0ABZ0WPC9_9BURK|nr:winged helix-turn-helix domain-containing protein [Paraburkholderia kururiensis]WQD79259.1 winged helix-turn-helix domain-containing protein [Paraburkholderia kururiensis]